MSDEHPPHPPMLLREVLPVPIIPDTFVFDRRIRRVDDRRIIRVHNMRTYRAMIRSMTASANDADADEVDAFGGYMMAVDAFNIFLTDR